MTQVTAGAGLFRLHRSSGGRSLQPTAEQQAVIGNTVGRLKVLAGPGTGKSATLVESVAERIADRGVPPESVLVLTFSRRAATELAGRITRRLGITTREPIVRTLHSYAYSLLRAHAVRSGEPEPRLLAAGESDQMVRELLAGQRESGRGQWPPAVSAALTSPAFAAELRELMLRTAERGITPSRLAELGRRRHRPEWQAAALFAREYQDVSDLRQGSSGLGPALDQAELTRAALGLLAQDAVLAAEQSRIRRVFVDEFQDVDPAQAALVGVLASGADELVVFGDPDQSIYGFRGSDPAALRDLDVDATVMLTASRRMSAEVLAGSRRVARMLPGSSAHRLLTHAEAPDGSPATDRAPSPPHGRVVVRTLPTAATEAAFVADELRRAHLQSGVRWSDMAVLVRSPVAALPALRRAFAAAGVPMATSRQDEQLTADPVVSTLLTVLQCGRRPALLTGQVALDLLSSPAGGMDGQSLRRLRRMLRAQHPAGGPTPDLLAAVLVGAPLPDGVPEDVQRPVRRIRAMLDAARAGAGDTAAEQSLWNVWKASDLEEPLVSASLRGGRGGQRADHTLDGVMALFAMAAELADRTPLAGVEAFLDMVTGQRIPGDPTARASRAGDAVAVLSAHAAKGLEWGVVAIVGVSEGSWPVLRPRVSLLGTNDVFDAAAGLPPSLPSTAAQLQEERRLFYVAVTRARQAVIATSVADQDTVPSRFLYELAGTDGKLPSGWPAGEDGTRRRALHLTDLLAELRSVVTDPSVPEQTADHAAAQLARLAAAGVVGADPREWYGLAPVSTQLPPIPQGVPVTVSPSAVDALSTCALRGVLERRGARGTTSQQQIEGIVVHALVDGLAKGVGRDVLQGEMERFLQQQHQLPPWLIARTRRALQSMLAAAEEWIAGLPADRTLAASELRLAVTVPPLGRSEGPSDHVRTVRLEGRADRLDRAPDGSLIVVDFKTGATVPSKTSVLENAQLAVYQLALELGAAAGLASPRDAVSADDPPMQPDEEEMLEALAQHGTDAPRADRGRAGGAELIYLRSGTPQVRQQPRLTAEASAQWQQIVRDAAERLALHVSTAQENRYCERCPVRSSCPLQPQGRQVTR
jgi:superfamily I DNA/RNA helicase